MAKGNNPNFLKIASSMNEREAPYHSQGKYFSKTASSFMNESAVPSDQGKQLPTLSNTAGFTSERETPFDQGKQLPTLSKILTVFMREKAAPSDQWKL